MPRICGYHPLGDGTFPLSKSGTPDYDEAVFQLNSGFPTADGTILVRQARVPNAINLKLEASCRAPKDAREPKLIRSRTAQKVFFLGALALAAAFPTASMACSCKAHFEAREGNFKPDVPKQHFSAHHKKGNLQNNTQCRRDAREDAQSCMSAIWRARWSGAGSLPGECKGLLSGGGHRFRGDVPRFIKRDIERAVCCQPSDFGDHHDVEFDIYKRTHGGKGCGPNRQKSESRFLSKYKLDCLAVRDRENRAGRFCGRIVTTKAERYDRPMPPPPAAPPAPTDGQCKDIANFAPSPNSWQACGKACKDTISGCRSWTWVPPGVQGPTGRCWAKNCIPWAKRDGLPSTDNRMVSGTVASPN